MIDTGGNSGTSTLQFYAKNTTPTTLKANYRQCKKRVVFVCAPRHLISAPGQEEDLWRTLNSLSHSSVTRKYFDDTVFPKYRRYYSGRVNKSWNSMDAKSLLHPDWSNTDTRRVSFRFSFLFSWSHLTSYTKSICYFYGPHPNASWTVNIYVRILNNEQQTQLFDSWLKFFIAVAHTCELWLLRFFSPSQSKLIALVCY